MLCCRLILRKTVNTRTRQCHLTLSYRLHTGYVVSRQDSPLLIGTRLERVVPVCVNLDYLKTLF